MMKGREGVEDCDALEKHNRRKHGSSIRSFHFTGNLLEHRSHLSRSAVVQMKGTSVSITTRSPIISLLVDTHPPNRTSSASVTSHLRPSVRTERSGPAASIASEPGACGHDNVVEWCPRAAPHAPRGRMPQTGPSHGCRMITVRPGRIREAVESCDMSVREEKSSLRGGECTVSDQRPESSLRDPSDTLTAGREC